MSRRRERLMTRLIILGYLLITFLFSLGPIFEGPDEIEHYRFIRSIARTGMLPDPYSQPRGEYHQAPLYYMLAAPLALLSDDSDFAQIEARRNPFYPYEPGFSGNDNKNLYLHTRAETFPFTESQTARSVHLIRLLSIALGLGTLFASKAIFELLWPQHPDYRLMALSVIAFMPQFLYLSSTINNDNLLFLLSTLSLWVLCRQYREGPSRRLALLLGIILGATLLTKVSALFLVFPVGLALLLDRRTWRYALLMLLPIAVIAGWWYLRNISLYGDPTAVRVIFQTWQSEVIRPGALALDIGLSRLSYSYASFWARFGQGAVPVSPILYTFFDLLTLSALTGLIVRAIRADWRSVPLRLVAILGTFGLAWIAALVYYASTVWSGNQGRYLLPALAVWGAMIAFGVSVWLPHRLRVPVALSSPMLLAAVALSGYAAYFVPAYRILPLPTTIEQPLALHYGDVAELIGMSPAAPIARPGEILSITLYWRALQPASEKLLTYLHSANTELVKRDSLPGNGNLLASDWQPGQTWVERYLIRVPETIDNEGKYPLVAGLYDPVTQTLLPVSADGQPVSAVIGWLTVSEPTQH